MYRNFVFIHATVSFTTFDTNRLNDVKMYIKSSLSDTLTDSSLVPLFQRKTGINWQEAEQVYPNWVPVLSVGL